MVLPAATAFQSTQETMTTDPADTVAENPDSVRFEAMFAVPAGPPPITHTAPVNTPEPELRLMLIVCPVCELPAVVCHR